MAFLTDRRPFVKISLPKVLLERWQRPSGFNFVKNEFQLVQGESCNFGKSGHFERDSD